MAYPNRPPPPPPTLGQTMGSTNIEFQTEIRLDLSYFRTQVGVLRCVLFQIENILRMPAGAILFIIASEIFNLIGIICISSSPFSSNGQGVFFIIIALLGLIYTGGITGAYLYHFVEKHHNWIWMKGEMFACIGLVFFNLITSTIAVAYGSPGYSAAGFFGYLCMVGYGLEAFLRAQAIKAGEPAQGHVVTNKQQHVLPSPS